MYTNDKNIITQGKIYRLILIVRIDDPSIVKIKTNVSVQILPTTDIESTCNIIVQLILCIAQIHTTPIFVNLHTYHPPVECSMR